MDKRRTVVLYLELADSQQIWNKVGRKILAVRVNQYAFFWTSHSPYSAAIKYMTIDTNFLFA